MNPRQAPNPARPGTGQRDAILERVRSALSAPTEPCLRHPVSEPPDYSAVLPNPGASPRDWLDQFRRRAQALRTDVTLTPSPHAAADQLNALADDLDWRRVAHHRHPLVLAVMGAMKLPLLEIESAAAPTELEQCDAAVTACDALIAQTGSVLLTSRSAGGRALSVLPPHHVVVATIDQLLPDLPAAYALLEQRYREDWPSFATLITGPSRTGDIERILVLGAHGPRQLTILLIGEPG